MTQFESVTYFLQSCLSQVISWSNFHSNCQKMYLSFHSLNFPEWNIDPFTTLRLGLIGAGKTVFQKKTINFFLSNQSPGAPVLTSDLYFRLPADPFFPFNSPDGNCPLMRYCVRQKGMEEKCLNVKRGERVKFCIILCLSKSHKSWLQCLMTYTVTCKPPKKLSQLSDYFNISVSEEGVE